MDNYQSFEKMKAELYEKGYEEKEVIISSGKAMILGVLYVLPFVIVFGLMYRFLLIERAYLLAVGDISFYIVFIAIIVISVIIHELLHGIGWIVASGKDWSIIRFNISAMMPSCACKVVLKKKQYLTGVLAPFVVLGIFSILFIFIYPGTISLLTMIVNFISAGADLIIALNIFKESDCLIADHPSEAGYIAFRKK